MNPVFPATYSTLCPAALSALISEQYDLSSVQCRLLVRGVGDTYLITTSEDRFMLRVYRSSHRSLPQIREEVSFLLALKEAGVRVSYPIADHSGESIRQLNAAEGARHAVLFSYAPGHVVRQLNRDQLRSLGREMALMHRVSAAITPGNARWHFDLETTLDEPLIWLQPGYAEDAEGYAWLRQAVGRAKVMLASAGTDSFAQGYCHFDFLPKNMHFEGEAVTFFDFDFMGHGWLVNDIMSFWQHLALDVFNGRMTQQEADEAYAVFLAAYREVRALSDSELAAVPYLGLGFWLFYMHFHTTHDQFYAYAQPAQVKAYTGFMKHLVAAYWS